MKINTILVPTDFSDHSISAGAYAYWLADNYQAEVRFLHVVQPETGDLDIPVISAKGTLNRVEAARGVLEAYQGAVDSKLRSMYQPRNEVPVSAEVIIGAPGSEIPKVISNEADLCVIGTRGKHNRLDHLFGSITTAVLGRADIPVFVIPAGIDHLSISSAGYATELDMADPLLIWRTASLLKHFNPLLSIINVQENEDDTHETSLAELKEFLETSLPLKTAFHELKGESVGERLRTYSKRHKLDLLVLHGRKRSWLEHLWNPSVSRKLALESESPILLIR